MAMRNNSVYAILGLLSYAPMSGYDIKRAVETVFCYFWSESYGRIYPVLKQLEADGLATCGTEKNLGKPDRNVYTITRKGREALRQWLSEPPGPLRVRHELLLKLVFGHNVSIEQNIHHLERHRAALLREAEEFEQLKALVDEDPPDQRLYSELALRLGELINDTRLKWCEESLAALGRAARGARKKLGGRRKR